MSFGPQYWPNEGVKQYEIRIQVVGLSASDTRSHDFPLDIRTYLYELF